ncbi:Major facilitator superfamily domain [Trinorchestia longiramus]|nr:Major facilitator superfamily domain [Trinorchestia longiramus]
MEHRKPLTLKLKLAYGVGHVMNDLCASMWFTYLLIYLQYVLQLERRTAGLMLLLGQVADAVSTPLVGLHSDSGCGASCCWQYGRRKTWHAIGTLCVLVSFPVIFVRCGECIHYTAAYSALIAIVICIFQFGWAAVQVSHLALIPALAHTELDRDELNIIRYFFDVSSDVLVYLVTWAVFTEDFTPFNNTLDTTDDYNFMIVTVTVLSVGISFSVIFHTFTPDPVQNLPANEPPHSLFVPSDDTKKTKQSKFQTKTYSQVPDDQQVKDTKKLYETRKDYRDESRQTTKISERDEDGKKEVQGLRRAKRIKGAKEEVSFLKEVKDEDSTDEKVFSNTSGFIDVSASKNSTNGETKTDDAELDDKDEMQSSASGIRSTGKEQGQKVSSKDSEENVKDQVHSTSRSIQATARRTSAGSSSLDEFDPRWTEKSDGKVSQSHTSSEEEFLLDTRVQMTWRDWLKEPQFYQVSMLYTSARLVSNLSNIYVPVYLQETGHSTQLIALVPLVMSLSGVIATVLLRSFRRCYGKKGSVLTAVLVGLVACLLVLFGGSSTPAPPPQATQPSTAVPQLTKGVVYVVASLWGLSSSMLMILSLALTADMIGRCTESSAFVYGCMSFGDKLANGLVVVLVQEIASERCIWGTPCGWFFEQLLGMGLGVALLACAFSGATLAVGTLGYTRKMRKAAEERGMMEANTNSLSSSDSSELLLPTSSQLGYGAIQHTHAV